MLHTHTPIEELPSNGDPEFAKHDVHVALDVAATTPLYLLAPQSVQVAEPVASLYLPATHPVHAPPLPLFPEYPALHAHAVTVLLPAVEKVFWAHAKQSSAEDEFNVAEYVF